MVITHPLPPTLPLEQVGERAEIFFLISIVTSCYDSFNCCYLLVIVVYFWHAWARLPLLPPEEMLFQAQIALRMFVHIAFVTSTLTEPSVVIFLFFFVYGCVCVLGKVPYWNRWWRRRGRFEAFLFVVFNIDRGGRRLGVPAEARRFLRKRSQVGKLFGVVCLFDHPSHKHKQALLGKHCHGGCCIVALYRKKKRKTIVKSSNTSCSSPAPNPCFFFFFFFTQHVPCWKSCT